MVETGLNMKAKVKEILDSLEVADSRPAKMDINVLLRYVDSLIFFAP
jgi:hypothetical protein